MVSLVNAPTRRASPAYRGSLSCSQQAAGRVGWEGPAGPHQDGEGRRAEEHGDRRGGRPGGAAGEEDHTQPEAEA